MYCRVLLRHATRAEKVGLRAQQLVALRVPAEFPGGRRFGDCPPGRLVAARYALEEETVLLELQQVVVTMEGAQ